MVKFQLLYGEQLWLKKNYENGFKANIALEAMIGNLTISKIATEYNVVSSLVSK